MKSYLCANQLFLITPVTIILNATFCCEYSQIYASVSMKVVLPQPLFPIFLFSFLFVNSYLGNSFKKFISHFMLMLRFGLILDNSLVLNPKKSFAKLDFDFFILKLAETNMMSFGLLLFLWWKVLGCFLQDVVYLISVYPVLNSKCHYSIFCSLVTIFE